MKPKTQNIITILTFAALLVFWGFVQSGLKPKPQVFLMAFGLCTFGVSFLRNRIIFWIPFGLILGMIVVSLIAVVSLSVLDVFLPDRGRFFFNGRWHGTNGDPYLTHVTIFSCLSTIGLLFLYFKKWKNEVKIERYFTFVFTVLVFVIWSIYEL